MGWQATVATLAADGLLITPLIAQSKPNRLLGFLPLIAATLTLLMALEHGKWTIRSLHRVNRLKIYDRWKGFDRFYFDEHGFLKLPLGKLMFLLLVVVATGLAVYSILVFLGVSIVI